MPVNIHGKEYFTVAERLEQAKDVILSITTEVLYIEPQVMVKATLKTDKGTFTGISAANPDKSIEAKTPVEVAETSAVGRALAFAGFAGTEIASADEMQKAFIDNSEKTTGLKAKCETCNAEMVEKSGTTNGKKWTALFCPNAKKGKPGHKPVWL